MSPQDQALTDAQRDLTSPAGAAENVLPFAAPITVQIPSAAPKPVEMDAVDAAILREAHAAFGQAYPSVKALEDDRGSIAVRYVLQRLEVRIALALYPGIV